MKSELSKSKIFAVSMVINENRRLRPTGCQRKKQEILFQHSERRASFKISLHLSHLRMAI